MAVGSTQSLLWFVHSDLQIQYQEEEVSFILFIPCIIDNIMTINQQNAQTSSLDIVSHLILSHISVHKDHQGIKPSNIA